MKILKEINLVQWVKRYIFILTIGISSLAIRVYLPGDGGGNSPNDDLLGVRLTQNLLNGDWLGDWNVNTLAKPPAYSFYLLINYFIPIELKYINHFLYLIVSYVLIVNIQKYLKTDSHIITIRAASFFFFALNPFIFQVGFTRVYRASFEIILILLYLIFLLKILLVFPKVKISPKTNQIVTNFWRLSFLASLLGFTYGVLHLTKASSYWILPLTLVLFALEWFPINKKPRHAVKILATVLLVGWMAYLVPVGLVGSVNNSHYGASKTENFFSGGFSNALVAWQSVRNGEDSRFFISVSKGQRAAVYKISSLARSLEPYLEIPPNTGWNSASCNSPLQICDEAAAWFPWALRDAAVASNNIQNEKDFQTFFNGLAEQITMACQTDKLSCGPSGAGPGVKSMTAINPGLFFDHFRLHLLSVLSFNDGGLIASPDRYGAPPEIIDEWHQVIRYSKNTKSPDVIKQEFSKFLLYFEMIYLYVQWCAILIVLICIISIFVRKDYGPVAKLMVYTGGSMCILSAGLSVFTLSLGWFMGGMYDLPIVINFIILTVTAINYLPKVILKKH